MSSKNTKSGVVKFFNTTKKFGFIVDDSSGDDIFFHVSGFRGEGEPQQKQSVTFETEEGKRGLQAVEIYPV